MSAEVKAIAPGKPVLIDLSSDELYGLSLKDVDFGWLTYAYMLKVDLRSSNLADSTWSHSSFLSHAYLQCANLSRADFRGANLSDADLRGANIEGANFEGAVLRGIKTDGAFGQAKGLQATDPATSWNPSSCASTK